jgi:hypothetical protein
MLKKEMIKMKEEIVSIIEEGRLSGLGSEAIVSNIFNRAFVDRNIVAVAGESERPLDIDEILIVVQKAVEQAEFEGADVVLPTGERLKKRCRHI